MRPRDLYAAARTHAAQAPDNRAACRRTWLKTALAAMATPWMAPPAHARTVGDADTSRRTRDASAARIPLHKLTPQAKQTILPVVQDPTLFRRMPVEQINCHPELFVFLLRYPEIIVNMWDLMGATKITLQRLSDFVLAADDGAGTITRVELVYGARGLHVLLADGEYSGPLFRRRLTGRSVLIIESQYSRTPAGQHVVTASLDVFLALENIGADLVARTLHPLVGKTADHNFAESARFVSQVSEQSEANPAGMQRLSHRLTNVKPAVREGFAQVVRKISGAPPLAPDVEPESARQTTMKAPVVPAPPAPSVRASTYRP